MGNAVVRCRRSRRHPAVVDLRRCGYAHGSALAVYEALAQASSDAERTRRIGEAAQAWAAATARAVRDDARALQRYADRVEADAVGTFLARVRADSGRCSCPTISVSRFTNEWNTVACDGRERAGRALRAAPPRRSPRAPRRVRISVPLG
jgi:hypothetical protein